LDCRFKPGHDIADKQSTSRLGVFSGASCAEESIHRMAAKKRI
jgi:hypothetical protein